MKKRFKIFLFALMLFFTSNNINKADASQFEGDAAASIKCAGAFFALTSISKKEPALGEYFQRQTELSLKIAVAKGNKTFSELHGRKMNKGEVDLFREYGIMFIDDFYTSSKKYVPQFVSDCLAWNVKVIKYSDGRTLQAVANNLDFPRHQDLAKYPHSNFKELVPHIYSGFAIWDEIGKPSPKKLKEALHPKKPKIEKEFNLFAGLDDDIPTPKTEDEAKKIKDEAKKLGVPISVYKGFYDEGLKSKCSVDWDTYERILLSCELDEGKGQSNMMMSKVTKLCMKVACKPSFMQKFKYD